MSDDASWTIHEGAGVVLPLHGRLLVFGDPDLGEGGMADRLTELEVRIAKVHLEMAVRAVEHRLHKILTGQEKQ